MILAECGPHPTKYIFDRYPRNRVAKTLGINVSYLSNILCGSKEPGKNLEERMFELADCLKKSEDRCTVNPHTVRFQHQGGTDL